MALYKCTYILYCGVTANQIKPLLCIGTHGSGINYGSLSSLTVELEIVTGTGKVRNYAA